MYKFNLVESNKKNTIEIEVNIVAYNFDRTTIIYFNLDENWKIKLTDVINTIQEYNKKSQDGNIIENSNNLKFKEINDNLFLGEGHYVEIAFITHYDEKCIASDINYSCISDTIEKF